MYSYDRRITAGRVTFGRFGRLDEDGGEPADILLDGVRVGEIGRQADTELRGVTERVNKVRSYVPAFQGPLLELREIDALDEKEFEDLTALKRAVTTALSGLPEGVSEAYRLYWAKKITAPEWASRVKALL